MTQNTETCSTESCPICMEAITKADMNLECGHRFHSKCGVEWLKKNNSCPLCRGKVCDEKVQEVPPPVEEILVPRLVPRFADTHFLNRPIRDINGVTTLNMNNSKKVTNVSIRALAETLKSNDCKITRLYLGHTQLTDDSVYVLADVLKHPNCKLTNLGLYHNQITSDGARYLADALSHQNSSDSVCKLTWLSLMYNQITNDGIRALADALAEPRCKLTYLILDGNQITYHAARALIDSATKFVTLYLRDISQLTDRDKDLLKKANTKRIDLHLSLPKNEYDYED